MRHIVVRRDQLEAFAPQLDCVIHKHIPMQRFTSTTRAVAEVVRPSIPIAPLLLAEMAFAGRVNAHLALLTVEMIVAQTTAVPLLEPLMRVSAFRHRVPRPVIRKIATLTLSAFE